MSKSDRQGTAFGVSLLLHVFILGLFGPAVWVGTTQRPNPQLEVRLVALDRGAASGHNLLDPAPTPNSSLAGAVLDAAEAKHAPVPPVPIHLAAEIDGLDAYVPVAQVDVHPTPEAAVVVPFPQAEMLDKDRGQVILVVFVGADGHVDRVDVERSDVARAFELAAADSFRNAQMRPGIKNGQPQAVRMKVLVEFEQRSVISLRPAL